MTISIPATQQAKVSVRFSSLHSLAIVQLGSEGNRDLTDNQEHHLCMLNARHCQKMSNTDSHSLIRNTEEGRYCIFDFLKNMHMHAHMHEKGSQFKSSFATEVLACYPTVSELFHQDSKAHEVPPFEV